MRTSGEKNWGTRSSKIWRLGLLASVAGSLFLFQNCGSATHKDGLLTEKSLAPPQNSLVLKDPAKQNTVFRISLEGTDLEAGTEYYWSSSYAGGTSCAVTVSADGLTASFTCAELGALAIRLVATATDGKMSIYDLPLVIGNGAGGTQPPSPGPTPLPDPGPAPDPVGAALYNDNCSSCHGQLATSAKKGITRSQLDLGIATIGPMAGLTGLTSTQRDSIVQALQ
ncbi:MAG: hypothetical protein ACXVA9_10525 [Bdellovibrionales bacterium]